MNKKMRARKRRQARRVALTLVLMLTVALVSIGGTLAWLTASTQAVTNTFTVGNIDITLTETKQSDGTDKAANVAWTAQMIPGTTYTKNPEVAVGEGSEKCFLFVKVSETNTPSTYLDYTYAMNTDGSGWTKLENVTLGTGETVWYRIVEENATVRNWSLMTNNQVKVKDDLKKNVTGAAAPVMPSASDAPSITFQAYACQYENMTGADDAARAASAWAILNPTPNA